MCLLGSGCLFKNQEYQLGRPSTKKRLGQHFGKPSSNNPNFPKGVLCAEQLKFIKSDSASSSVVIDLPRRNFNCSSSSRDRILTVNTDNRRGMVTTECQGDTVSTKKQSTTVTQVTQSESEAKVGVTFKKTSDASANANKVDDLRQDSGIQADPVPSTLPDKRKVSPSDSGMYSTDSSKDWTSRDASLGSIDPTVDITPCEDVAVARGSDVPRKETQHQCESSGNTTDFKMVEMEEDVRKDIQILTVSDQYDGIATGAHESGV